ncbi:hypothetical protein PRUPE_3G125400 [Prunus persica]|uniref:Uncharacterized protein n=1 Tax=Prunus persica TaxID=3760 RepID=A0A251PZ61_PRUPE|nr:hypothetical protein PRUPE_3G125400 [Prunus persica]ONI16853.1 hypothetical protein PRUPE_3G125400 [Prunus persica]
MNWVCVEIVDQDGKSSLLSPVKAFDSVVLAIYEGFCNLKQVHFSQIFVLLFVGILLSFCIFSYILWLFA